MSSFFCVIYAIDQEKLPLVDNGMLMFYFITKFKLQVFLESGKNKRGFTTLEKISKEAFEKLKVRGSTLPRRLNRTTAVKKGY